MAGASVHEAALSIGSKVGRYFGLTSMIPSLLLVIWTYALLSAGALNESPDMNQLKSALGQWSPERIAWILLATFVLALLLHPLQFATTQLFEGYWGTGRLGLWAATVRARTHRRQLVKLSDMEDEHDDAINNFVRALMTSDDPEADNDTREGVLSSEIGEPMFGHVLARTAAQRAQGSYPLDAHRVMPTRLGNALRRYEDRAGKQYGLDAILVAPHIALVAPSAHASYMTDSRQEMDLSIRLCFMALLATVLTTARTMTQGWWLVLALVPYAAAYLTYKGAVAAAHEYGTSITAALDLNRFRLYEALGLVLPRNTTSERNINAALTDLLGGDPSAVVRYATGSEVRRPESVGRH